MRAKLRVLHGLATHAPLPRLEFYLGPEGLLKHGRVEVRIAGVTVANLIRVKDEPHGIGDKYMFTPLGDPEVTGLNEEDFGQQTLLPCQDTAIEHTQQLCYVFLSLMEEG